MRSRTFLAATIALGLAVLSTSGKAWGVPPLQVEFNNNSGLPDSQVYIGFVGPTTMSGTNVATNQPLAVSQFSSPNWYTLDTLPQGIDLTAFSGRIYVGYGTPWTFANAGYEPPAAKSTDPNYLKVYDKMELTYDGGAGNVADTTSIDYFSIPLALQVYKGGTTGTLVGAINSAPVSTVVNAISPLTAPTGSSVVTDGGGNFVRVIGPGSYSTNAGQPTSGYNDFTPYLNYLQTYAAAHGGVVATIEGQFNGVGTSPTTPETMPQHYDFTVSIDSHDDLTLTGGGALIGMNHTMEFMYSDLINPDGIYGANASFYLDGSTKSQTPQNDIYGWVTGDILAGLNVGAVGSTVTVGGQEVGLMQSQQWFQLTNLFSALQPNNPDFYNQYAAAMGGISQAYNFAYSDRFAHVTVPLDPARVDTLVINIGGIATPEPASSAMLALGAGLLLAARGARRFGEPRSNRQQPGG